MTEEFETQDSIPEGDQDTNLELESIDTSEELTKTKEYANNQKIRAEKAERELKALRSTKPETETPKKEETQKSNEPDYAKIAFLEQRGVKHPDDQKFAQEQADKLGLPLTDVLGMEYVKEKLKNANDQREAQSGMPKGKGRAGGGAVGDVDHWIDQKNPDGTFKTPEDLEMANKVIDARIKKESNIKRFSDILYTG